VAAVAAHLERGSGDDRGPGEPGEPGEKGATGNGQAARQDGRRRNLADGRRALMKRRRSRE
jgi:hypothetical protein